MIFTGSIPAYFAADSDCPNERISYPSRVRQISAQTAQHAKSAIKSVMLAGEDSKASLPKTCAMSNKLGKCVGSGNAPDAGSIWPKGLSTSFRM